MDPVRLFRVLLGAAIFLLAAYVFEPSLFGGLLPAELMSAEMFRNVVGVVGGISGILVVFDALFPKRRTASSYRDFEPPPAPLVAETPVVETPVVEVPTAETPVVEPNVVAFAPPSPPPPSEPEPEPEPDAPLEPQPDEEAAEPPWGSYVAPDEPTVAAARSLVEAELAEGATKPVIVEGLPPPPPRADDD